MSDKPTQPPLFPDESELNYLPSKKRKKLSLDPDRLSGGASSGTSQEVEGIPRLILPTRWENLQPKIESNSASLRTIIRPVSQAMQVVRSIVEYVRTTTGCQVLVIRADTGSGKTTFLNTLPHYMPDVGFHIQTIDLQFISEDDFASELEKMHLRSEGINLVILEGREKPETVSDKYIQVVLSNINRFSRAKHLPILIVIPTIEEHVARAWCDHASKIGDLIPEGRLYDGSRWYTFPGVSKDDYIEITKETVRVLNSRNLEDFGVSVDELNKWVDKAPTIGRFMETVAHEATHRRATSMLTVPGKREHVWILFCGPDYKHYDHTYLVVDGLCHDEKLRVSPTKLVPPESETTYAKHWREPAQWARLVTTINFLDIRMINFSIIAAVSSVLAYGDKNVVDSFKEVTIGDYLKDEDQLPEEMLRDVKMDTRLLARRLQAQNAQASMERSNLFALLRDMPATRSKGFRTEEAKTLAQYLHLIRTVSIAHIHFCIGKAIEELLKYHQFSGFIGVETEKPLVSGQTDPIPDVTIHTETDVYALEFHFFSKQFTSSEMSRYSLRSVIDKYMRSLPHLNSQLSQAYDSLSPK